MASNEVNSDANFSINEKIENLTLIDKDKSEPDCQRDIAELIEALEIVPFQTSSEEKLETILQNAPVPPKETVKSQGFLLLCQLRIVNYYIKC
jgi:hypothetical protein